MIALTVFAPVLMLVVFGDEEWFGNEFDLLVFRRLFAAQFEFTAAFRTGVEFEFDGLVDLIFGKGDKPFAGIPKTLMRGAVHNRRRRHCRRSAV